MDNAAPDPSPADRATLGPPGIVWPLAAALAVAAIGLAALVLRPSGEGTAREAALASVPANAADPKVIASRGWGDGVLAVTRFTSTEGQRHLALAFAIDRGRGWRVAGYTEQPADPSDVGVGSLLVASSAGGAGQPPWSAAYGELSDDRIARVEVSWQTGSPTAAEPSAGAYIVVRRGQVQAVEVRFLAADGSEIARVPVT